MAITDSVCSYVTAGCDTVGRQSELVLEGHRVTVSPNSDNKLHFSRRAKSNFHVWFEPIASPVVAVMLPVEGQCFTSREVLLIRYFTLFAI